MRAFVLGSLLAATLLVFLLYRVDMSALGRALASADPVLIAAALGIKVFVMCVKAWRWALAIEAGSGVRPREGVLSASMVGFAGNILMPARLGELARVLVLRRHLEVPRMLTLTSAGIGQLLDLTTLVLLTAALAIWGAAAATVDRRLLVLLIAIVAAIFAGLAVVRWQRARLEPIIEALGRRLPSVLGVRLVGFFEYFNEALEALRRPGFLMAMIAFTAVIWLLEAIAVHLALVAVGVDVGWRVALLLMATLNLSFVVPLTPGNVGVHQLVSTFVLALFGVSEARALAFSIALQGSVHFTTLAIGGICFYREGMDVATLRRQNSPPSKRR